MPSHPMTDFVVHRHERSSASGGDGARASFPLKCLRCEAKLASVGDHIGCPQCHAQWPVTNGIPRFYQAPEYYWGEISRSEANTLLAEARRSTWQQAVERGVKEQNLRIYYLDLQRASWLALLGLNADAVALDIGSGYGAITHSLALSLGHVCSVEAIPERIEFTQERLRQEKLSNVSLFQASATELPFFEESFDLIVANGILEWVGEWDLERSPRDAQLKFLSSLQRLLKKDGVLVVGIENRFGAPAFRGYLDHSGTRYTSLMPRRVATWFVRHAKNDVQYAFIKSSAPKEYRTYTYSPRGYRKLIREAGFAGSSLYWAHPGYNRPQALTNLSARRQMLAQYAEPSVLLARVEKLPRRHKIKLAAMRCFPSLLAHELVIFGFKEKGRESRADQWLRPAVEEPLGKASTKIKSSNPLISAAAVSPFSGKSVLRLSNSGAVRLPAIVKYGNGSIHGLQLRKEHQNLSLIREKLLQAGSEIKVPQPLGSFETGKALYTLESLASGVPFSQLACRRRYSDNVNQIRADFSTLIRASVEITKALKASSAVAPIGAEWYKIPEDIDAAGAAQVEKFRYFSEQGTRGKEAWNQHGDFVVGNIFFDQKTGNVEIIDWSDLAGGYPPLYDILTLIVQSGVAAFARRTPPRTSWDNCLTASFSEIFLQKSELGAVFNELIAGAGKQLGLSCDFESLIIEFLLIRINNEKRRGETTRPYLEMLHSCLDRFSAS